MSIAESWRWVVGYEGVYMISDHGRVMRVLQTRGTRTPKVLSQGIGTSGYKTVVLSVGRKAETRMVHRMVAEAFIDNDDAKEQVNHIDGDKTNNAAVNLEWCTRSENAIHAYRVLKKGRKSQKKAHRKLTDDQIVKIYLSEGTIAQIGERFGVSDVMVSRIKRRKSWKEVTECH